MTCFICMDDTIAPRAECLCTSRFVHTNCLKMLIEKTGQLHCLVCLAPYDVIIKKRKRCVVSQDGFVCIILLVANICIYYVAGISFIPSIVGMHQIIVGSIVGSVFLITTIVTIWWLYTVCYHHLRFFRIQERIQVINIPERLAT